MSYGDEEAELKMELPPIWEFVHPEYARRDADDAAEEEEEEEEDEVSQKKKAPKLSKLLRFLNDVDDEEELERMLQERDPVTQQTLLQWAVRQQHYLLSEYLVKLARRAAFGFPVESTDMVVYAKWEEMRPELPTPEEVQAQQQRLDRQRLERLAAKQREEDERRKEDDDEDEAEEEVNEEDEEDEDNESKPLPEELVYEALEEYHDEWGDYGISIVKKIGELGVYVGARLRNGTKQGLGQALFPNGDAYTGEYDNNQRHGLGLYWWAAQSVLYTGYWYQGVRHGYGRIVYPDGSRYRGMWSREEKHGNGRYMYADGSSYDGAWEHNKKHGYGVYRFTDGSSFRGNFVENAFTSGEWCLASGITRYVGNFVKDAPVGAGLFLHRLGSTSHGAFQQEGYYHNGEWHPGVLHGTTRVPPRLEVLAPPNQEKPKRVPMTFASECSGGRMVDLVKAANFPPMRRWMKSLVTVGENHEEFGVVLVGIEVSSLKYDDDGVNLVEVRFRAVLHDAAGRRLHLSSTGDETITLRERTTRLLVVLGKPENEAESHEPLVVLERSVQLTCPGKHHMQCRLPTVQVSPHGEIEGPFVRAIQPTLRIALNLQTTKHLFGPIPSNPIHGAGEEDVFMYVQDWHPDAYATINEKLEVTSRVPPPPSLPLLRKGQKQEQQHGSEPVEPVEATTEGCSYVAIPFHSVMRHSSDAITAIAVTLMQQLRRRSQMPMATVAQQRPPTPLPPAPEPRPELQPLYDARAAMRLAEEEAAADDDDDDAAV